MEKLKVNYSIILNDQLSEINSAFVDNKEP